MKKTASPTSSHRRQTLRPMAKRFFSLTAILFTLFVASGNAEAICAVNSPYDISASYGAAADAHASCALGTAINGGGSASSASASLNSGIYFGAASADLASGVVTAYATNAYASSLLWDTFIFSGLPAGGATLTEALALTGSISGNAEGWINLMAGNDGSDFTFDSTSGMPDSVSYSFQAENGVPIKLGVELEALALDSWGGGTADLLDPPTFGIFTPAGVTYTSASGAFANVSPFAASAVPEPASYALFLAGLVVMGLALKRRA